MDHESNRRYSRPFFLYCYQTIVNFTKSGLKDHVHFQN